MPELGSQCPSPPTAIVPGKEHAECPCCPQGCSEARRKYAMLLAGCKIGHKDGNWKRDRGEMEREIWNLEKFGKKRVGWEQID